MIFDIKNSDLGKETLYPQEYNAKLLFRIPRSENREKYNLNYNKLPFVGYDVWNCYEMSFLTASGLPISRLLKIIVPSHSVYLIESKSLKLYLFSYNMERFTGSVDDSESLVLQQIKHDLEALLETSIKLSFLNNNNTESEIFETHKIGDLVQLLPNDLVEKFSFTHFKEEPALIKGTKSNSLKLFHYRCDLLRSNCRVTNQPDWGELFITIESYYEPDILGLLAYIVSFREENHFHEEVVEVIYSRLQTKFTPEKLMVAATYTRRGGIDINPIRASHESLIDKDLINEQLRIKKTYRQ